MLTIVADRNIPGIGGALRDVGTVEELPGELITPDAVRRADILLVRSVTRVDGDLLKGSTVRFVGTATAGIDHVDTGFLRERGIEFAYAPGSNAPSVVDYVLAALFHVAAHRHLTLKTQTIGIVGFGNVGSRLATRLRRLGLEVLVNDPPLEESTPGFARGLRVVSLSEMLGEADIISLHVPLARSGPHPTVDLIGRRELSLTARRGLIINTARGGVINQDALLERLTTREAGPVVLDVFRGEPLPARQVVEAAWLATPHIAGYALDSKLEGARVMAHAVRRYLGLGEPSEPLRNAESRLQLLPPDPTSAGGRTVEQWTHELIQKMYDVERDSLALKQAVTRDDYSADSFRQLRHEYPVRRTFDRYELDAGGLPGTLTAVAAAIGVTVRERSV